MKEGRITICLAVVCLMAVVNFASAELIRGINMDFVSIGNAGNAADTGGTAGRGAVSYNYRIGKYEVTNTQWNAFTAAVGAPTGYPSTAYDNNASFTDAQQPTNNVSWYEAAQFCNYLTSGNKNLGAYQLSIGGNITIDRASAISTYGTVYVIPTENEWYKAAYFKPNSSGYSYYAYGTGVMPIAGVEANFNWAIGSPWNVGAGQMEQNGTFNMMGNVEEWNETLLGSYLGAYTCGHRGGSYYSYALYLGSGRDAVSLPYTSYYDGPSSEINSIGFRVASIPEPATIFLLGCGCILMKKRK